MSGEAYAAPPAMQSPSWRPRAARRLATSAAREYQTADMSETPAKPAMPETPTFKTSNLIMIGAVLAVVWALVIASGSRIAMGVMGVTTGALIGLGVYVWRMVRKQQSLMGIMAKAQSGPEGRAEALKALDADGGDKDAMNLVVRAQLEAQDDPAKALATLESIDMKKLPFQVIHDVRALKVQLLLVHGRVDDAVSVANDIELAQIQQPDARVVAAASVAEAWGRGGKEEDALALLKAYNPEEQANPQVKVLLYYARIFSNFAKVRRELVRKDMTALCKEDPNYLGRFMHPKFKVSSELQDIAKEVAMRDPEVRKMAQRMGQGGQRQGFRR